MTALIRRRAMTCGGMALRFVSTRGEAEKANALNPK